MNAFLTELDVTPVQDGRHWKLLSPFKYCADLGADGELITVPAGFISDLASIPRFLWDLYPPEGQWDWGAVVHDYLYVMAGVIPGATRTYSKLDADNIFRDALALQGVGPITRNLMYAAVRRFGKGNFK